MTTLEPTDYLYGTIVYFSDDNEWVRRVIPHRITKRTAKRIYYVRDARDSAGRTGSVNRATLETEGKVTNRARGYYEDDYELYATHEAALAAITLEPAPTLQQLRRAAAEAHPDLGGTHEAFLVANARYEKAKERAAA